ncbi:MAG: YiiX/YebB-like N1pC/P60 family cysteine hydrolase [Candidatus Neomarinimicrobiota bacterium]
MAKPKVIQFVTTILLIGLLLSGCGEPNKIDFPTGLKTGDLIFLRANRSEFWKAAGNRFGNIGIVMDNRGKQQVLSVNNNVRFIAIDEFTARKRFEVRRLLNYDQYLHPGAIREIHMIAKRLLNTPEDRELAWDNSKFYSAELVWKVYYELLMMVELSKPGISSDIDWTKPAIRNYMNQYMNGQVPKIQTLILPDALYSSKLLETVYQR